MIAWPMVKMGEKEKIRWIWKYNLKVELVEIDFQNISYSKFIFFFYLYQ